jgi:hypothetical protein
MSRVTVKRPNDGTVIEADDLTMAFSTATP